MNRRQFLRDSFGFGVAATVLPLHGEISRGKDTPTLENTHSGENTERIPTIAGWCMRSLAAVLLPTIADASHHLRILETERAVQGMERRVVARGLHAEELMDMSTIRLFEGHEASALLTHLQRREPIKLLPEMLRVFPIMQGIVYREFMPVVLSVGSQIGGVLHIHRKQRNLIDRLLALGASDQPCGTDEEAKH